MTLPPPLTYDEAARIALDLKQVWTGMTGLTEAPTEEALTDLVQRVLRREREIIKGRDADV